MLTRLGMVGRDASGAREATNARASSPQDLHARHERTLKDQFKP